MHVQALSKSLYYISRFIHILLLPIVFLSALWFPTGRWWEIIGLAILFTICFYPVIIKINTKFFLILSFFSYLIVSILFFPKSIFESGSFFDYRVFILADMLSLCLADVFYIRNIKYQQIVQLRIAANGAEFYQYMPTHGPGISVSNEAHRSAQEEAGYCNECTR